jgi:mRNA interferase MazF
VLIISSNYENLLDVVTIIPISSKKVGRKIYLNELLLKNELQLPSILLCQQIRTILKKRLVKKLTSIGYVQVQRQIVDVLCMRFETV